MRFGFVRFRRLGRHAELAADRLRDGAKRHALLRHGMIGLAPAATLQRKTIDARHGGEHRGEAVAFTLAVD